MRIAVMGTGGVGGYFGSLLARAGEDVTFIARGEHLRAIQESGLRVESVHGDFLVAPAHATARPPDVGPVDLVLLTTKTYQLEEAARDLVPLLGPDTAVLPLQNGVDAPERVAAALSRGDGETRGREDAESYATTDVPASHRLPVSASQRPVLGGACWVVSEVAAPGLIRQQSQFRRIVVGELDGGLTPRVERIVETMARAGIAAEASRDIRKVLWTKFLFIAPFSGLAAVTRSPAGPLMSCPKTRELLEEAMREVAALAVAEGVALDSDVVAKTMDFCEHLAPDATASMQRDILAGRPSELEAHNGFIARRAAAVGLNAPVNRFIYAALLPQENRARGS